MAKFSKITVHKHQKITTNFLQKFSNNDDYNNELKTEGKLRNVSPKLRNEDNDKETPDRKVARKFPSKPYLVNELVTYSRTTSVNPTGNILYSKMEDGKYYKNGFTGTMSFPANDDGNFFDNSFLPVVVISPALHTELPQVVVLNNITPTKVDFTVWVFAKINLETSAYSNYKFWVNITAMGNKGGFFKSELKKLPGGDGGNGDNSPSYRKIGFVAASQAYSPSGTSYVIPKPRPSDVKINDILVCRILSANTSFPTSTAQTVTPPGGWTLIRNDLHSWIFWRKVISGEAASYTFTLGSNLPTWGEVLAYRNVDTTAPVGDSSGNNNTSAPFMLCDTGSVAGIKNGMVVFFVSAKVSQASNAGIPLNMDRRHINRNGFLTESCDRLKLQDGSSGRVMSRLNAAALNIGQAICLTPQKI